MDMVAFLRYVFDHNQQVIAGLVVVILVTAILLFLRAIGQEKPVTSSASGGASNLDIGAIEAALKKVMAAQSGSTANSSAGAQSKPSGAETGGSTAERDTKIQELAREIDRLTTELASKSDSPFGTAKAGVDPAKMAELQSKIDELEGKLFEYEIIEDDIADLSKFKEENAELRSELELLRKSTAPQTESSAAPVAQEAESLFEAPALKESAQVRVATQAPAVATPELVAIPVEPDPNEIELRQLASSIDSNPAFDDVLDTDKMLAEVAGLSEGADGESDGLDDSLDTDKLMSQVDSLDAVAAASPVPVVKAVPLPVPVAVAPAIAANEPKLEDDLLAEFKETNDGGQG